MTQTPPPSEAWSAAPAYPATTARPGTSGLAIASLVTGIVVCFVFTPIIAVILGYLALEQIADSGGTTRGRGMALAGITLGWVWIGLAGLLALIWIIITLAA